MIFHENRLLADDSLEISFIFSFQNEEIRRKICRMLPSCLALIGIFLKGTRDHRTTSKLKS